jgi:ABC-type transport system involved in multi-copper enzyme maturation permease subunit
VPVAKELYVNIRSPVFQKLKELFHLLTYLIRRSYGGIDKIAIYVENWNTQFIEDVLIDFERRA